MKNNKISYSKFNGRVQFDCISHSPCYISIHHALSRASTIKLHFPVSSNRFLMNNNSTHIWLQWEQLAICCTCFLTWDRSICRTLVPQLILLGILFLGETKEKRPMTIVIPVFYQIDLSHFFLHSKILWVHPRTPLRKNSSPWRWQ